MWPCSYYLSRTLSDFPMDCAYPVLFIIIVYFMGALRLEAWAFFGNLAALLLITQTSQSIGLFVGAVCMDMRAANTLLTVIILTFMLIGGFYIHTVPVWIAWFKYIR
jgi:ABC-2 type transporter